MRKESQGRYTFVVDPSHPMADSRGRILEHRYVVSNRLGRPLTPDEIVHHENQQKKDNTDSNLELTTHVEHGKLHNPASLVALVCAKCATPFTRRAKNVHAGNAFCTRPCAVAYQVAHRPKNPKQTEHGTYGVYRRGCRCAPCRQANANRCRK